MSWGSPQNNTKVHPACVPLLGEHRDVFLSLAAFSRPYRLHRKKGDKVSFCINMVLWELFMFTSRSFSLEWAPAAKSRIIYLTQPSGHPSRGKAAGHQGEAVVLESSDLGLHPVSAIQITPEAPSFSTPVNQTTGSTRGSKDPEPSQAAMHSLSQANGHCLGYVIIFQAINKCLLNTLIFQVIRF